jgi:integrase/recombinase XerD
MKRIDLSGRWSTRQSRAEELDIILNEFKAHLAKQGYALRSRRHYVGVAEHFERWMRLKGYGLRKVDESLVSRFQRRHLPWCQCPPPATACATIVQSGLRHWLRFLRCRKLCPPPPQSNLPIVDRQVRSFDSFLKDVRGLAEATRRYDRRHIRQFLEWRFGRGPLHYEKLRPKDVADYLHTRSQVLQPSTLQLCASSLRRFLRFLRMQGMSSPGLERAILTPATHGASALPKTFTDQERSRLLRQGFKRQSDAGRRDYAMALCQLELGLRAGEVARLRLEDLDWSDGVVIIRQSKSRRERRLPLLAGVGRALSAYIKHSRPRSASREIFLRHFHPKGMPLSSETVRGAMREAYRRAGLARSWTGTHVLRRTFATRLLQRGAGLKAIADLLGHRGLDTTTAYTRIDIAQLRRVALPWPR